tara:strand:- start:835 stop:1089 length:255 start_codon:yes stop_codon:yes gene_type:complete
LGVTEYFIGDNAMDKHHVWLDSSIGLYKLFSDDLEGFENLIGELNAVLIPKYGCQIQYDEDPKLSEAGKTTVNGFAILVSEVVQ